MLHKFFGHFLVLVVLPFEWGISNHFTTKSFSRIGPTIEKYGRQVEAASIASVSLNDSDSTSTSLPSFNRLVRLNRTGRVIPLWNLNAMGWPKENPKPVTASSISSMSPEDNVALLFVNALRVSHNVPPLNFSLKLKSMAKNCSNYHAMRNENGGKTVAPCPSLMAPSGKPIAAELFTTPPIGVESRQYRQVLWNWYMQVDLFNWAAVPLAYDERARGATQIIWNGTTEFACARSTMATKNLFVVLCLYSPPGNEIATFADNVFPGFI